VTLQEFADKLRVHPVVILKRIRKGEIKRGYRIMPIQTKLGIRNHRVIWIEDEEVDNLIRRFND
jgi:hypothetical protein